METIKNFLNKENYTKVKLAIVVFLAIVASVIFEYGFYTKYIDNSYDSKTRMLIVAMAFAFVGLHFVLKLNNLYEWIYRQRYKLAAGFLVFVMLFKLSGSSIVNFNDQFQTNSDDNRFHPLLGFARMVRTDEWATSTLYILSQGVGNDKFQYFDDELRGVATDMFTLVNSPVKDILMLGKPFQIMFLLLGNDRGLSFYWYIRLVAMLLGSFEICMLLTNGKKRISLCGMLMITFSSATQWWYCMDTLIWGQIILLLLNKFMETDKKSTKILCGIGEIVAITSYIFILYPAWQVSFAYVFLAIFIWIMITNFKNGYKINLFDCATIVVTLLCVGGLLVRWFALSGDTINAIMHTDYPGERREVGGGATILYAYFYNLFFAYKYCPNPCEASSMLSFYPLPILLSVIYVILNRKDKKHWKFFLPAISVSLFLTIWCKWGFPEILAKCSLMSMTTAPRATIPLGTLQIYMLIYLFAVIDKETKWFPRIIAYILPIFATGYMMYQAVTTCNLPGYFGFVKILISTILFGIAIFGIFNSNNEKIKHGTLYVLMFIALVTGIAVNPVIRTTDVIYEKPICSKFAEIREQDPDALWLGDDTGIYLNNYMVANGLRTIDSTNVYPNLELFELLLGENAEPQKKFYNRYEHMNINLTDGETHIELPAADNMLIWLNYHDLQKLGIDYIVVKNDINERGYEMNFEKLYEEDGLYIFKPLYE